MLALGDIEKLMEHQLVGGSRVLSVYLDVDQTRIENRGGKFENYLERMLDAAGRDLGEAKRAEFEVDAARVRQFVSSYTPKGRSLAVFCDDSDDFFQTHELNVPLRNEVRWSEELCVRPLLEAMDEHERYGVIFTDKKRGRLFTVFLGEIEEELGAFMPAGVKHVMTTGRDRRWSQKNFQRSADFHTESHLKHVAQLMGQLARKHSFDRLVLVGPQEVTSELSQCLPDRLKSRIAGVLTMPTHASEQAVLEETLKLEAMVERKVEEKLLDDLIGTVIRGGPAVLGGLPTLKALNEKRVWKLVYAEGTTLKGSWCEECAKLFEAPAATVCDHCKGKVSPVDDLIECMSERVLRHGGKVEQVRGGAAHKLKEWGGVGAILSYS